MLRIGITLFKTCFTTSFGFSFIHSVLYKKLSSIVPKIRLKENTTSLFIFKSHTYNICIIEYVMCFIKSSFVFLRMLKGHFTFHSYVRTSLYTMGIMVLIRRVLYPCNSTKNTVFT